MNDRSDNTPQPANEEIAIRAYEFYCDQGCEDGHDLEHWLKAESEFTRTEVQDFAIESRAK